MQLTCYSYDDNQREGDEKRSKNQNKLPLGQSVQPHLYRPVNRENYHISRMLSQNKTAQASCMCKVILGMK